MNEFTGAWTDVRGRKVENGSLQKVEAAHKAKQRAAIWLFVYICFIMLLLLCSAYSSECFAEEKKTYTDGGITYTYEVISGVDEESVRLTMVSSDSVFPEDGRVTIPEVIDGLPVTDLDVGLFYGCKDITLFMFPT